MSGHKTEKQTQVKKPVSEKPIIREARGEKRKKGDLKKKKKK